MIDFHTHILPCIDDGSKSVNESILMLKALAKQGVNKVIATPHYYANNETVNDFIKRRDDAYELLNKKAPDKPDIFLGAEVRYYDGISHLQDIDKLRIEGTMFLMIEMPFKYWTEWEVKELIYIAGRGKITLVLAHVDRYLPIVKCETITELSENGVLFQVNTSFFDGLINRSKAIKMLKQGQIHFIGSDCHNTDQRPPNIQKALCAIKKKLGNNAVEEYLRLQSELFQQNKLD